MADGMHRYPDGGTRELRDALGAIYGIEADRIVCGAGSDEIIALLCLAYAGPGDEVLYSQHGFLMYELSAKAVGATPVKAPEIDLKANVDNLVDAVTDNTRIVFLANPNNPTGTYLSIDEMKDLRARLRDDILLVVDAAYAEFVTEQDYNAGIDLVEAHDNVVMTRTFSKLYALGGLRLGWGFCSAAVADVLNRVRGPFNVSSAAQAAGIAALEDGEFSEHVKSHNETWREWTANEVRKLGYLSPPSAGNFILVRFSDAEAALAADAHLRARGIIIRRMAGYGLPESLRVSIGLEDEMRAFIQVLSELSA